MATLRERIVEQADLESDLTISVTLDASSTCS